MPFSHAIVTRRIIRRRIVPLGALLAVALSGIALAQTMPGHHPVAPAPGAVGTRTVGAGVAGLPIAAPTMAGQDAFGAVQEIVSILEADPETDWSKVNLEALRQHLIDMNQVTLRAAAAATEIDGGLRVAVTGTGRTLAAIRRMIPAHAAELDGRNGWNARTVPAPDGMLLTVTASDPREARHIRGLGFAGLMASGGHHQMHHLALAKGEFSHTH